MTCNMKMVYEIFLYSYNAMHNEILYALFGNKAEIRLKY